MKTKKHVMVRMPVDVHKQLKFKIKLMEDEIYKTTGKKKTVAMTKVMRELINKPVYWSNKELRRVTR